MEELRQKVESLETELQSTTADSSQIAGRARDALEECSRDDEGIEELRSRLEAVVTKAEGDSGCEGGVCVKPSQEKTANVHCRNVQGQQYSVAIPESSLASMTVNEFKCAAAEQHSLSRPAIKLVFRGSILKDDQTLGDCNVSAESVLHLVISAKQAAESETGAGASKSSSPAAPSVPASRSGTIGGLVPIWVPSGSVHEVLHGESELRHILVHCAAAGRLCVVDWYAPWCGPCNQMEPLYTTMASQHSNISFVKIAGEKSPANRTLLTDAGVSAFPTLHVYSGLNKAISFSGADMQRLTREISSLPSGQPQPLLEPAVPTSGSTLERALAASARLQRGASWKQFLDAMELMAKLIDNIVQNPDQSKFRKVRLSNQVFSQRIASLSGHENFMKSFGFELEEDKEHSDQAFVMNSTPGDLSLVRDKLNDAVSQAKA